MNIVPKLRVWLEQAPVKTDPAKGRVRLEKCFNEGERHTWVVYVDGKCVADVDTRRKAQKVARECRDEIRNA